MIGAPLPYPDELLPCTVTRCCRWHCIPMKRLAAMSLGVAGLRPHLLAVRPVSLFARLFELTPEYLLWNHTNFPYATAFCSADVYEASIAAALDWNAPYASLFAVMQNATFGVTRRRLCPDCVAAEMATYGITYWHRSHHLPGVLLCAKHGEPLIETDLPATNNLAVTYTLPHEAKRIRDVTRTLTPALMELAKRSVALLARAPGPGEPQGADFYRALAVKKGWLSEGRQVAPHALHRAMRRTFPNSQLKAMGIAVGSGTNWPSLLFRAGTSFNAPALRQLLLQTTLELATHTPGELDHVSKGPSGTAPAAVDAFYSPRARKALSEALERHEVLTTEQFLRRSASFGAYRHLGAQLPRLRKVVRDFRSSPASVKPLRAEASLYGGRRAATQSGRAAAHKEAKE